jgi:hypothetical protein
MTYVATSSPPGSDGSIDSPNSHSTRKGQEPIGDLFVDNNSEYGDSSGSELSPLLPHYDPEHSSQLDQMDIDSDAEDSSEEEEPRISHSGDVASPEHESDSTCSNNNDSDSEDDDGEVKEDVDGSEVSEHDNDGSSDADQLRKNKKGRVEQHADFTLLELKNSTGRVEKIPRPAGTGGRDYNIREMMGLGIKTSANADWYRDISVSYNQAANINILNFSSSVPFVSSPTNILIYINACASNNAAIKCLWTRA